MRLSDLLDDAIKLDGLSSPEFGGQIVHAYAELPTATLDRHRVLQIMLNLLSNARYAVRDASDRRIGVRCAAQDGRVILSVEERGMGVPAENLQRIFQYGFTTKPDGHGFGLHSSANAAREIGGSLSCHSDGLGQGATFTLEFPMEMPAEGSASAP